MTREQKFELAKIALVTRRSLYWTNALIIIIGLIIAAIAKLVYKDESLAVAILIGTWFFTPSFSDLNEIIGIDE